MNEWWTGLTTLNQFFYVAATFFSVFFVWQMIMAIVGLGGGEDVDVDTDMGADVDVDVDADADVHGGHVDADSTIAAFRLVSVRSVLAFCTLFAWAGALYQNGGMTPSASMGLALLWGVGAMLVVAKVLQWLLGLTESGTSNLATCVDTRGTVYLDIPSNGQGEVRVTVSGALSLVKARGAGGQAIRAGTPIRVVQLAGPRLVEVESLEPADEGKDEVSS